MISVIPLSLRDVAFASDYVKVLSVIASRNHTAEKNTNIEYLKMKDEHSEKLQIIR